MLRQNLFPRFWETRNCGRVKCSHISSSDSVVNFGGGTGVGITKGFSLLLSCIWTAQVSPKLLHIAMLGHKYLYTFYSNEGLLCTMEKCLCHSDTGSWSWPYESLKKTLLLGTGQYISFLLSIYTYYQPKDQYKMDLNTSGQTFFRLSPNSFLGDSFTIEICSRLRVHDFQFQILKLFLYGILLTIRIAHFYLAKIYSEISWIWRFI